jgi:superfamily I DNA and RNA helicase
MHLLPAADAFNTTSSGLLAKTLTNSKTVMVLPAFETNPRDNLTAAHALADGAAMVNKEELLKLVDKDEVYQFHVRNYRRVRMGPACTARAAAYTGKL